VSTNGRTPPHDENAERVLIGLALSLGRIPQAATRLVVADFYQPVHAVIWSAMHALAGLGRPCDVTALRAYLQERGMLNASTGVSDALLIELIGQPTPVDADYVVDIILERAKRRSLIEVFERGLQHAYESSDDVDTQLGHTLDKLSNVPRELTPFITADWLGQQVFPDLAWVVPGMFPEGYGLLVGAPKIGKSWLSMSLGIAASAGGYMFGKLYCGRPRPVLMLALEDSHRRLQSRIRKLQPEDPVWPAELNIITEVETSLVVPTIEGWLANQDRSSRPLVILDTIGKVIPPALMGEGQYQRDYHFSSRLHNVTKAWPGMTLIGLHHDRKASAEDFVETVSGTNGLAGAADTIVVINRPRNEPEGVLKVTGRDVEEAEYGVKLVDGQWDLLGKDLREASKTARTVHATVGLGERSAEVVEFIADHPEGVRAEDIVPLGFTPGEARVYLSRLYDSGRVSRPKRGLYTPVPSVTTVTKSPENITLITDGTGGFARAHARARDMATCAICQRPMRIIEEGQTAHPACEGE